MRTLLIDNYDSYTFNLFQLLGEVNGEEPIVVRNDQLPWEELRGLPADNIVLSPGPGTPENAEDFGVCRVAIERAEVPVLGVCLGHQGLGHVFGGCVRRAPEIMHGRLSQVFHDGLGVFANIPQGFSAVRYHSLAVYDPLPSCLRRAAWTAEGVVMGLCHCSRPLYGVQFHPESVATEHGRRLIENFRDLTPRPRLVPGCAWRDAVDAVSVVPRSKDSAVLKRPPTLRAIVQRIPRLYDTEQAFVRLFGGSRTAFWLDSSRVEPSLSRFSFMGSLGGPLSELVTYRMGAGRVAVRRPAGSETRRGTVFDHLAQSLESRRTDAEVPFDFVGGFVGYLGYELKAECGGDPGHPSPLPDAAFIFADRLVAFDHLEKAAYLIALARPGEEDEAERWLAVTGERLEQLQPPPPLLLRDDPTRPLEFHLARPYDVYMRDIEACMEYLRAGESYEICLTNELTTRLSLDPLRVYRVLRCLNPAPYAAYLRFNDFAVLSSSPERFLKTTRDRWAEAKPIKGTAARGRTHEEDVRLCERLRTSEKDRAENLMIVDLLRNDLGLVCDSGTVQVPKLMDIESYQTVHQMVSTIRGRLRDDVAVTECIRAAFPGGSMTGAPKRRTMEIIDRIEQQARGIYSGAIGFLSVNGTTDLNIVIRTIVMARGECSIGVGGAIVIQSDPGQEFEEILLKGRAPLEALAQAAGADGSWVRIEGEGLRSRRSSEHPAFTTVGR